MNDAGARGIVRGALCAAALAALSLVAATPAFAAARPRVCLVLSGGGARGIPHIGVLKVL